MTILKEALSALEDMQAEFRALDLPYGSKAYTKANEVANKIRGRNFDLIWVDDIPALVVEKEPDYMNRGHYCPGTKPYVDPTKVWALTIGTKLYTRNE